MNELSLFTGAGGGLLGSILLGWHPIGYVEWDDYCQRVIAARIKDGILPDAPIFGNIKTFISDWYAASYQGLVDVITGGFPCQPFSVAGKQKGADDERNMWPATAECIGIVRPRFVLLENVPGIRTYLPVVVRDLRRLGYEVSRPLILGADDIGAPHRRKRVWIVANRADSRSEGLRRERENSIFQAPHATEMRRREGNKITGRPRERAGTAGKWGGLADRYGHVTDTPQRQDDRRNGMGMDSAAEGREGVNASAIPCNQYGPNALRLNGDDAGLCASEISQQQEAEVFGGDAADADETGWRKQRGSKPVREEYAAPECGGWSESWPEVAARLCRVDDGVAHRVDRLKALGNGQVPQCMATAFRILTGQIQGLLRAV